MRTEGETGGPGGATRPSAGAVEQVPQSADDLSIRTRDLLSRVRQTCQSQKAAARRQREWLRHRIKPASLLRHEPARRGGTTPLERREHDKVLQSLLFRRLMAAVGPANGVPNDLTVIALAASAGSLATVQTIVARLPADLPAAVVVARHTTADHREDVLPRLLQQDAAVPVRSARQGDRLEPGVVYVAPPGRHVVPHPGGRLCLLSIGRINHVCPCGDLLLTALADAYGERAVGVVLSGTGTDGALGTRAIRRAGGTVLAQDPRTCAYPNMPLAAMELGFVDLILPPEQIAGALATLATAHAAPSAPAPAASPAA